MWILLLFVLTFFINLLVILTRNNKLDRGVLAADVALHGTSLLSLWVGN